MTEPQLFDKWTERYNQWFKTPVGKLIKEIESNLVNELLDPGPKETILDAGCGTGVFTVDILAQGAQVVGIDISQQMLKSTVKKTTGYPYFKIQGDMLSLPFKDNSFDKSVSITALEFITDAKSTVDELFRVTRPGGYVVIATLNSLSLWATRRKAKTKKGQRHLLENALFRSPQELFTYSHLKGVTKTAIHFQKNANLGEARQIERVGRSKNLKTGAFVVVRWEKPYLLQS